MPQKRLKDLLPTPEKILESRILKLFAPHLADPRLWHFNRHSLNKAVYIGVLSAFFPLPGQMLLALIGSLIFRANVPMALGLTWITNPVTSLPIFYAGYYIGAKIIDVPMISLRLIGRMIAVSLTAFCVGSAILAIITSIICGLAFKAIWRYKTVSSWQKRQHTAEDKPPKR